MISPDNFPRGIQPRHVHLWDEWNEKNSPGYPSNHVIRHCLRRWPNRENRLSMKVLDLGCGNGVNTWFLAREGFSVTATDISERGIARTEQRLAQDGLSAVLRVESAEEICSTDSEFDLVVCVGVLEAVDFSSSEKIIRSIFRVLKKGGEAFIVCAGEGSFNTEIGNNAYKLHGYTQKEIENLTRIFNSSVQDRSITTFDNGKSTLFEWKLVLGK